jgi:hypothetical protein
MRKYGIHNITKLANNRLLVVASRRSVLIMVNLPKLLKYEISSHSNFTMQFVRAVLTCSF